MKMTEEEAIAHLRTFNAWRCGDESQEAPTPSTVTEAIRTVCDALEAQRRAAPVAYEISHESPADIPHYKGADVFTADKIAIYESHGFTVRALTYAAAPAQPATGTAGDARDAAKKECSTCKHADRDEEDFPCRSCTMMSHWSSAILAKGDAT